MRPLDCRRFGRFLYAMCSVAARQGWANFPERRDVAAEYEALFGRAPSNLARDYILARDNTSVHLTQSQTAPAYYLFQRREIRRFDFDAVITRGSTAAGMLAAKYLWRIHNPGGTDFRRRLMAIKPSACERELDLAMKELFRDGHYDRFELLEKGDYIKVERGGSAPGSITLTNRVLLEDHYLHLLTRDYLAEWAHEAQAASPPAILHDDGEDAAWAEWERRVRGALAELLRQQAVPAR